MFFAGLVLVGCCIGECAWPYSSGMRRGQNETTHPFRNEKVRMATGRRVLPKDPFLAHEQKRTHDSQLK